MKKIALKLRMPMRFEDAKKITANVKHYVSHGGSDYIDELIVEESFKNDILKCLAKLNLEVDIE